MNKTPLPRPRLRLSLGMESGHSEEITEGVRVRVAAQFEPQRSNPEEDRWVYSYRVRISNEGDIQVQLLNRHWIIRDAENEVEEVRGPGVVGEQPVLMPGETFEYVSGCPLPTNWGTMEGSYEMETEDKRRFHAKIGRFFLAATVAPIPE
ncbi:MAG: Co2+/Mg2+ efflux protein ApaG [Planctomycetota bacterium]